MKIVMIMLKEMSLFYGQDGDIVDYYDGEYNINNFIIDSFNVMYIYKC